MTESQATATRFCARVIGPLLLIMGAVVIARFDTLVLTIPAILQDSPLTFITGAFTLIVGLVLFVAHHHWSGASAILVSLLGLLTIVRGVVLLLVPDVAESFVSRFVHSGPTPWIAGGITLLIGLWLSYDGWIDRTT